ncbi:betaine--homocysteine S-methyltransferase 1-like isoform X2 [Tubulanus polymorphus]|uniref:betaine--homocysteine S-methyltransferase 1-like isoform X2 n=1 Tax=Tubulanus polymorphus TaxID=672921 RepID=UPI003DA6700E
MDAKMTSDSAKKKTILDILAERPVVGDGSYVMTLEKRGYVTAGYWTPEVVLEEPDAVRNLHREFVRAGADVVQAFSFFGSDSSLKFDGVELNRKACELAHEEAQPHGLQVCGGISPTKSYKQNAGEDVVKSEFRKQCDVYIENNVDFLLGEFFGNVIEAEWAVEVMKSYSLPVACTMRTGPKGDFTGVDPGQCAVRLAKKGADIVGVNCQFDYHTSLETIELMKQALDEAGLKPHLMTQPLGLLAPEVRDTVLGYTLLPEAMLALDPRVLTRWECRDYARKAYDLGVRYIGGCCQFESHHIREIAEEFT